MGLGESAPARLVQQLPAAALGEESKPPPSQETLLSLRHHAAQTRASWGPRDPDLGLSGQW